MKFNFTFTCSLITFN